MSIETKKKMEEQKAKQKVQEEEEMEGFNLAAQLNFVVE